MLGGMPGKMERGSLNNIAPSVHSYFPEQYILGNSEHILNLEPIQVG